MQYLSYNKPLWVLQGRWILTKYSSVSQSSPVSGEIWQSLPQFPETSVHSHKKTSCNGMQAKILPFEKPRLFYSKSIWDNSYREFNFIISVCSHSNPDKSSWELNSHSTDYLIHIPTLFSSGKVSALLSSCYPRLHKHTHQTCLQQWKEVSGVLPCQNCFCFTCWVQNHARTGRKHRSHCPALPSVCASQGSRTDPAQAQDHGGHQETAHLHCGVLGNRLP